MSVSLDNFCIHTITTKPWDLDTAAREYAAAGVKGIAIWRDAAQAFDGDMRAAGLVNLSLFSQ